MCSSSLINRKSPQLLRQSNATVDMTSFHSNLSSAIPIGSSEGASSAIKSEAHYRSAATTVALVAALFFLSFFATSPPLRTQHGGSDPSNTLKDEIVLRELNALKQELEEKRMELAWEHQHISNLEEKESMMIESFVKSQKDEEEWLKSNDEKLKLVETMNGNIGNELNHERKENAELRAALKRALKDVGELSKKQQQHAVDEGVKSKVQNLRGNNFVNQFRPGDSVEIWDYQDGKTVLLPGVISAVNEDNDGPTYDVVEVTKGVTVPNVKSDKFRPYVVYPHDSRAYYRASKDRTVPVTIVDYKIADSYFGFNIHGHYRVQFDGDGSGVLQEIQANRVFRYEEN